MKRSKFLPYQETRKAGQSTPSLGIGKLCKRIVLSTAILLMSMPATYAAQLSFEDIAPNMYAGGDSFTTQGYTATVLDSAAGPGLAGAMLDGADPFSCFIAACPVGNDGHYFAGINDGGVRFARADALGFQLGSLDFSFVAPVGGLINFTVGQLVLTGKKLSDGSLVQAFMDFPEQINGDYEFATWKFGDGFGKQILSELSVSACLYDMGACVAPAMNQAQFALDNVTLSAVPEPATYLLMALGLAGLMVVARRRTV